MKLIKRFLVIILFFLYIGEIIAQTPQVVSGTITEVFGESKEPLPGVNVSIVNSQNRTLTGTVANVNGQYNLKIPQGENSLEIVFSYIGMKTQKVKFSGQKTLNVTMESDERQLGAIEITAERRNDMGITNKEMVSPTQKVIMDDILATSPVVSVEEALQGQLGGVDITAAGDPGAKSAIRIRGTSTLNASADPLIVIDGVPYTTEIDDFDFSTANEEDLSALLNISPSDIESIEVLKDASATAIWGTKGANGVLVITTKKGKVGKTNFSFTSKFTSKIEPKTIPMLNGSEYTALMQDAIWNSANYLGVSNPKYLRLLFDTPEIGYNPEWKYFDEFNQNTDWLKQVRQTANTWDNSFSMSGGGEKATYRFSLSLLTDDGTTIGTSLKRIGSSANINYQFSNKLRFGTDFSYSESNQDANWASTVRSEAFGKMPNKSVYFINDATGLSTGEYFNYQTSDWEGVFKTNSSGSSASNYNPVAMAKESTNETIQRDRKITVRADYRILKELTYKGYVSINMKSVKNAKFLPQEVTGVAWISQYANMSSESYSENLSIQTENKFTYIKNWNNRHNLIANALFRTSQSASSSYSSVTSGMASSGMSDPVVGTNVQSMGSGESEGRSVSGIGLVNYTLLDRYVIQGSLNMESNSAMGKDQRMGYFPGAGFAWNIHNEPFLEGVRDQWLDQAKLRFSYGQSGRAPKGNSIYLGAFSATDKYMDMSSIEPVRMQLDNLKWETNTEYNVGIDLSFFHDRLRFTGDYYHRYATDLLQSKVGIPSTTGFSQVVFFNSGKMENRGWELRADAIFFKNKDWQVSGYVNISRNENKITEIPVNMSLETGVAEGDADLTNGQYAFRVMEGQPLGAFYGYKYKGVYQNKDATYARDAGGSVMNDINGNPIIMKNGTYTCYPGDAIYEDVNHDGVINKYDMVYLGNAMPTLTGGASLTVKYKQVSMTAFFHGRFGQSVVNSARMSNESMYGKRNQSTAVLRRWTREGDDTDIPRALYNEGLNWLGSDRFVEDASFVRLKTLSISYSFPKKLIAKWGLTYLNVFATGYNLFTWTDYTGQDPEVSIPSPNKLAIDGATTPVSKRFSFGINLNF